MQQYSGDPETLEGLVSEVKTAADGITDSKYAAYYLRVADKLLKNPGYAQKELDRLERIIGKGTMAGEKYVIRRHINHQIANSHVGWTTL